MPFTGKSKLAAKLTAEAERVVFFDPCHDYGAYAKAKEITVSQLLDNPKLLQQPSFRYAVIPNDETIDEDLYATITLVRAAKNAVIVLDEVGDYRKSNEAILNKLARNGRHDGIVPVYVSQVAVDIPLSVRRLTTRVYSYWQAHKEDIEALAEYYGEDFANNVANAQNGELTVWILPTLQLKRPSKKQSESSTDIPNTLPQGSSSLPQSSEQ